MKIALVINELNIRGGTHKQLLKLAIYLTSKGYKIRIFTKFYDIKLCFPEFEQFEIYSYDSYFRPKPNRLKSKLLNLIGYFKMKKDILAYSDLINIHDNGFAMVQMLLSFSASYSKIIWQINDLPPYFHIGNTQHTKPKLLDSIPRFIYKRCAKKANRVTVNVTKNAERVKQYYNVNANVLYCGVDLRFQNLSQINKQTVNGKIKLLSIGVFFPYRNYETFLKIIDYINDTLGIDCEGVIVGSTKLDENYADKIQTMIDENKTSCEILGNITEEKLMELFSKSDAFLFLNKDQSWGLAVFEAMNMGLPTFVSESVGATELLTNGENAIIVDPMNHERIAHEIVELLEDTDKVDELVRNSFEYTKTMTWDNMYSSKLEAFLK